MSSDMFKFGCDSDKLFKVTYTINGVTSSMNEDGDTAGKAILGVKGKLERMGYDVKSIEFIEAKCIGHLI